MSGAVDVAGAQAPRIAESAGEFWARIYELRGGYVVPRYGILYPQMKTKHGHIALDGRGLSWVRGQGMTLTPLSNEEVDWLDAAVSRDAVSVVCRTPWGYRSGGDEPTVVAVLHEAANGGWPGAGLQSVQAART